MSLMGKVPSEVSKEARQFKIESNQSWRRKPSSSGIDVPRSLCLHGEGLVAERELPSQLAILLVRGAERSCTASSSPLQLRL